MNNRYNIFTVILFLCFGHLPGAQAVSPPPDGGYPGANTAEGQNALLSLSSGTDNTAVGFLSLRSNTAGNFNTGLGAGALLLNTGDLNTATGAGALLSNITGTDNSADGVFALFFNTATGNTAVGSRALLNNTTGGTLGNILGTDVGPNVAVGCEALESNTVASANTAMGYQALQRFTTGPTGSEQFGLCTAVGFQALANATGGGIGNCGFGYRALYGNTSGAINTAVGHSALYANTEGTDNTAVGAGALMSNLAGFGNTAIGARALENSTGTNNTAIGYAAGTGVDTGSNNIFIGAGASAAGTSDTIVIGHGQTTTYISGIYNTTIAVGTAVVVDSNGQLGTTTSSRRFKEEIEPMGNFSEALFSLNPVMFCYKKSIDPKGIRQLGLVAEDIEKVNPDLVVRDRDGKAYSVRYDQVNAMLLNEFLKEHRKVQQLEGAVTRQRDEFGSTIADLKKDMAIVMAHSKEQDAKIQQVCAAVELNKPAPEVAVNRR